jgi:hypothetical protein
MAASPQPNPDDGRSAFERFEDLTKRIVQVPKAEVDKLRKKQESRKRRPSRRS